MVRVTINSFGYVHGAPEEPSDITLDIRRHVPGTHQIPDAEPRTGLDPEIANAVLAASGVARLVDNTALLAAGILDDVADARARLVKIAVGDARGVHWSVGIAEEIARVLRQNGVEAEVVHREIQVPRVS
ncbi:glmZ(sRNA)-inactivating NTPase [Streptomyces sp. ADI92-24]|uniref:RapZ C-terminal domain-containing protein n=1 Tax=Streptomyces sp. ADI92-24 TaxID=1522756 RepID=UPI000F54FCFD|nr:RNase adapter RapZ [Streptomyces sp. ADI92-24]RPK32658.1 glmZ(sRNA)-inactivating NTPase [Streptomyces sp. ADI92-24]